MRRRLGVLGVVVASLLAATPARALATSDEKRAEALYDRATQLAGNLEYDEAIALYEEGYRLAPEANFLFQLAMCYERRFRFTQALQYYERYLVEAGPKGDKVRTARRHKAWLESLPARVRVSGTVPSATVKVVHLDSGRIAGGALDEYIEVPAGSYVLEVSAPRFVTFRQRFSAEIGQYYNFVAQLPAQTAELNLTLDPPDSRIFLDSRDLGTGRSYNHRVPVGFYNLRLEHPERSTIEGGLELVPGETVNLSVQLPNRVRSGAVETYLLGIGYGGFLVTGALFSADVSTAFVVIPSAVAGGAIGLLGATYLLETAYKDQGAPTQGTASFVSAGPLWGAVYGVAIAETWSALAEQPFTSTATPWRWALGGSLVGLAVTAGLASPVESTPGDSALIHSGAGWGTMLGLLGARAFGRSTADEGPFLLAGINTGLAAGLVTSAYTEWSREHVFWLDCAILAGIAGGAALERAIQPKELGAPDDRTARFALAGGAIGLGTGVILLRNYDKNRAGGRRRVLEWFHPTALVTPEAGGGSRILVGVGGTM